MTISWQRFWYHLEDQVNIRKHNALLISPAHNPKLIPFPVVEEGRLTVLYGEPGMGKTWEVKRELLRLKDAGIDATYVDLGRLETKADLDEALKSSVKCIFLDAYDEARLDLRNLTDWIIEGIERDENVVGKLKIATRTSIVPNRLIEFLGSREFKIAELVLAPLQRADVTEAARAYAIDPEAFFRAIEVNELHQFASRPKTLLWLLDQFKDTGQLPSSQSELYKAACLRECRETNMVRLDRQRRGDFDEVQRFEVASFLAALTVLTDKAEITENENADTGSLRTVDVLNRNIPTGNGTLPLSRSLFEESLETGLFIRPNTSSFSRAWQHRSTQEFLAAYHLNQRGLQLDQLKRLFRDLTGGIRPQLQGTAGWLAAACEEFRAYCLQNDPRVLLNGDNFDLGAGDKQRLFHKLVALYGETTQPWIYHDLSKLVRLKYPSLREDVSHILDTSEKWQEKAVAIKIGEVNGVADEDRLLRIVLDSGEPVHFRAQACTALKVIQLGAASISNLRELAKNIIPEDSNDELRAELLTVLFPQYVTAEEMFAGLFPPRNPNYIGAYFLTLSSHVSSTLGEADLPSALRWLMNLPEVESIRLLSELVKKIIDLALRASAYNREIAVLTATLGRRLLSGIHSREWHRLTSIGQLAESWNLHAVGRREILDELLRRCELTNSGRLMHYKIPWQVLVSDDAEWWIEKFQQTQELRSRQVLAEVINSFPFRLSDAQRELVIESSRGQFSFDHLEASTSSVSATADADISGVQEAVWLAEDAKVLVSLQTVLQSSELGTRERWTAVSDLLARGSSDILPSMSDHWNPTLGTSWVNLTSQDQNAVVTAAREFLGADTPPKLQLGVPDHLWVSAYRALKTLQYEGESLPARWSMAMFRANPTDLALAEELYASDQEKFRRALKEALLHENYESYQLHSIELIRHIYDPDIELDMLDLLDHQSLSVTSVYQVLTSLLDSGSAKAFRRAVEIATDASTHNDLRNEACTALLVAGGPDGWEEVRGLFAKGLSVTTVIEKWSSRFNSDRDLGVYSAEQLEAQFLQIAEVTSPELEYVSGSSSLWDTTRMKVALLGEISIRLEENVLRRLRDRYPKSPTIQSYFEKVVYQIRTVWTPPSIDQALKLLEVRAQWYIESREELLDLVNEKLMELQGRLHGETPLVYNLWNETPDIRPKHEDTLSNQVKQFLAERLPMAVVNREVEIRKGEKGDVQVDAKRPSGMDITVVIEVKGDWNPEVDSAIDTQLLDRYLSGHELAAGVYLIGKYQCPMWSDNDYNRKQASLRNQGKIEKLKLEVDENPRPLTRMVVLDCRYPGEPPEPKQKKPRGRPRKKS